MTNLPVLYLASAGFVSLLAVTVFVLSRLLQTRQSPSKAIAHPRVNFRPMKRLLSAKDFEFLANHPGYNPSLAKQLRSQRVRLMRVYMDQLSVEFSRLHLALRLLMAYATEDRPEASMAIVRQRWMFGFRMLEMRARIAFFAVDVQPADFAQLVDAVENLRSEVARLSQPVVASAAMASV